VPLQETPSHYCRAIVILDFQQKKKVEVKSQRNQARVDERKCSFDFGSLAIGFMEAKEQAQELNHSQAATFSRLSRYFLIRYG
jgi:hypothetical protein